MGSKLVMTIRAEESLGPGFLYDLIDLQNEARLLKLCGTGPREHPWRTGISMEEAQHLHPNAHGRRQVSPTDVWEMLPEPMLGPGGPWHSDPKQLAEHNEKIGLSLEGFLNEHKKQLRVALRSGWWLVGKLRVQVVECEPVTEGQVYDP